mmetsp:Transcript_129368/g.335448  ORF Transcript_129368/g.335448 Transcript_129368/m.335448 type:complete len:202 (-) Transcript_129368:377-982(-)
MKPHSIVSQCCLPSSCQGAPSRYYEDKNFERMTHGRSVGTSQDAPCTPPQEWLRCSCNTAAWTFQCAVGFCRCGGNGRTHIHCHLSSPRGNARNGMACTCLWRAVRNLWTKARHSRGSSRTHAGLLQKLQHPASLGLISEGMKRQGHLMSWHDSSSEVLHHLPDVSLLSCLSCVALWSGLHRRHPSSDSAARPPLPVRLRH